MRSVRLIFAGSAASLALGAWFIFWALSDSLLNIVRCGNEYSLSSPMAECRRPVIFEILGFVLWGLSLLLLIGGWRRFRFLRREEHLLSLGAESRDSLQS